MKKESEKKILLAVDGSESALDAVRYVGWMSPFRKMKIVLFHVFSSVPESYRDLQKDPRFSKLAKEVMDWETQQKKVIQKYMDKAKKILISLGFSEGAVTVTIQNRKKGVARDVIAEALNGYEAVVVGRRGYSNLKEIIIGSVARKVIEKNAFIPVLLVGMLPPDEKILLAIDPSENAMRAVDFVGETLSGFEFKITLFHVIRGRLSSELPHLFLPKERLEEAKKEIDAVLEEAVRRLRSAGFKPEQLTTKVVTEIDSRAASIIQEARDFDYRTIIIGRKGVTKVREFFMGRVSNKVISTIRNRTIWVIP